MNLIDICRHLKRVFDLMTTFEFGAYSKDGEIVTMIRKNRGCKIILSLASLIAIVAYNLKIPVQTLLDIVSPIARDHEIWRKDTS